MTARAGAHTGIMNMGYEYTNMGCDGEHPKASRELGKVEKLLLKKEMRTGQSVLLLYLGSLAQFNHFNYFV